MADLALRILLHDRVRFAITAAGVAFAASLSLVQIGLFLGIIGYARVTIDHIGADLWVIPPHTSTIDFPSTMPDSLVSRVRTTPGVARADNLLVWFHLVNQPGGGREQALAYALSDFRAWGIPWDVRSGSVDDLRGRPAMLVDDAARRRFEPYAVGERRDLNSQHDVRIVGTTHGALSFTTTPLLFFDYHQLQLLNRERLSGRTSYILVKLAPGADAEVVAAALRRRLPNQEVIAREAWAERSVRYWLTSTGLGMNMGVTALLGAIVAILVVAQTLYASAVEHRREFATALAIGATRLHILGVLLRLATYASGAGLVLGAGISLTLAPVLSAALGLTVAQPWWLWLGTCGGILVIALVAGAVCWHAVADDDPAMVFRG